MDAGNFIVILVYIVYLVMVIFRSNAKSLRLFEATDADVKAWLNMKDDLGFFAACLKNRKGEM